MTEIPSQEPTDSSGPADAPWCASRIIDANTNRLCEALRVIEDFVRYGLDDLLLVKTLKAMRHDLVTIVEIAVDTQSRLTSRDTLRDVGTTVTTSAEMRRDSLQDVVQANFHRAQQASRSLEEALKTCDPESATKVEAIRYQLYTLQKAIFTVGRSQTALADVEVYVLIDGQDCLDSFRSYVTRLIDGGVDAIQLREKRLSDAELLLRCQTLCEMTRNTKVLALINDRSDLAVLGRADGVHLGQDDLDVRSARRIVGSGMLIGVSTHSLEQAKRAVLDGANYLGIGPVFSSTTKSFAKFAGPETVEEVVREISLPTFAIGGINESNVDAVAAAGAKRVAVSALLGPQTSEVGILVDRLRASLRNPSHATKC